MKSSLRQARKFSIRFTVGSMFLIATMMTALVAISLQYHFGKAMSQEQVMSKLTLASADVSDYVKEIELSASNSARILKKRCDGHGKQIHSARNPNFDHRGARGQSDVLQHLLWQRKRGFLSNH